jgi:hypothetical protein
MVAATFLVAIIGVSSFSSLEKIYHMDIVYAKGRPIACQKFDLVLSDVTRQTVIKDWELMI